MRSLFDWFGQPRLSSNGELFFTFVMGEIFMTVGLLAAGFIR